MPKYIINGKRYILEKRNLLCEFSICRRNMLVDLNSKTSRLYFPKGKVFIVDVVHDITGQHEPPRIISSAEAIELMNQHPEGIKENVYIRYFGKPEDV